nr:hypothetical protein [Tanacetum cinerariifolium]
MPLRALAPTAYHLAARPSPKPSKMTRGRSGGTRKKPSKPGLLRMGKGCSLLSGDRDHMVAIAVNDTFKNSQFQSFLDGVRTNLLLVSDEIARLMAMGDKDDFSTSVKLELIKRAKLTGSSADKKRKLKQLLSDSQDRQHTLIYSSEAINDGKRDIDRIVQIAGRDCQWRVAKFTAEESKDQRAEILGSFRAGDIDAIVAIKCLDEGVDIPQTKTAYILASSTNPRQFIQRRGRVLRQYDGKGHASIYDFIAIPPLDKLGEDEETFNIEKSMVERELDRINEFAEISENYGHTLSTLRDIRKKLKLLGKHYRDLPADMERDFCERIIKFYGEVSISFSTDDKASVTVIHGENGAGKTSLLNAFKWVLYGTTDFDTNNENILSEKAIAEAGQDSTIVMSVTLEFDDDGVAYTAHREQKFAKGTGLHAESLGPSVPLLTWINSAGLSGRSSNPGSQLNQILPEDMHGYFFFNGERIEKLAYNSASTQVREAIKCLMGMNILERAEKQLKGPVIRHFNKEAKDSSSGNMTVLLEEQSRLTDQIQQKEDEIKDWKNTLSEIDLEIEAIDKRLQSIEAIAEKQKRRKVLEEQLEQIKIDKADASAALNKNVTERGFLAFIESQMTGVKQYLDEIRIRGEMPSKIKATFIDDLIGLGKCICGQPLEPGSDCVKTLESYKTTLKDNGVEEQFMALFGVMSHLQSERKALFANINESMTKLTELADRRKNFLGQIDELGEKIKGVEDSADLEERRGGIYPIVMDSPFGALDPEYRQKVATFIPALADQVIVMVSKSQWRGEVESELSKRLGKQYTLKYHKPDQGSDEKF